MMPKTPFEMVDVRSLALVVHRNEETIEQFLSLAGGDQSRYPGPGSQFSGAGKNSGGGLIMDEDRQDIIIYNTADGKASVSLYAKDGMAWTSQLRSEEKYSKLNAAQMWRPLLKDTAYRTWRLCFGPWIGSDWKKASLHTTGDFFKKQLTTKPEHRHKADISVPAWTHGAGDGWLLLKGPSSEYRFNPWEKYLSQKGVRFFWEKPLTRLKFDGTKIDSAFSGDEKVVGDAYIIAINPFIMAEVLSRTPELEELEVLRLFKPLTRDGPHTQVSFRLAFPEKVKFPRQRVGVVVSDSEFNLTLFAQEQVWGKEVDLGNNIQSLWTGTSCCSSVPGRIYHKTVEQCTKEEFVEEIKAKVCINSWGTHRDGNCGSGLVEYLLSPEFLILLTDPLSGNTITGNTLREDNYESNHKRSGHNSSTHSRETGDNPLNRG
jgi:hypothetical protein